VAENIGKLKLLQLRSTASDVLRKGQEETFFKSDAVALTDEIIPQKAF